MKSMLSLLLPLLLHPLPYTSASTANFEDAQRLKDRHADCRLVQLQEWHNGHGYDLSEVTSAWVNRGLPNRTSILQPRPPSLQTDLYENGTVRRPAGNYPTGSGGGRLPGVGVGVPVVDLQRGILCYQSPNTTQGRTMLRDIIRLTASPQIVQRTLRRDHQLERLLQQRLDQCRRTAERHRLTDTLTALVDRSLRNKYRRLVARYSWEHQPFPFDSLLRTWSQYWHHVRRGWQPKWHVTESQEWTGFHHQLRTGQHSSDQSEFWRQNARPWEPATQHWLRMNCTAQTDYLKQRRMLTGMSLFGFLVSQAAKRGIRGPTGSAFSLRQTPPTAYFTVPKERPPHRDLFVLTAERLVPKDLSSRVHAVVFGKTISHDGREYAFNATSGQFVPTCGHRQSPQDPSIVSRIQQLINHRHNSRIPETTRRLGRQIDRLLCMYEHRRSAQLAFDNYYRELRAWHKYGRARGLPEPTLPVSPAVRCGSSSSLDLDLSSPSQPAERKQEQIERLHQEGRITDSEYSQLSEMNAQYRSGCNGGTHSDPAQDIFTRSDAVFNPETGRYEEPPSRSTGRWSFNPLTSQYEKPAECTKTWNPITGQFEPQKRIRYDPRTGRSSYVNSPAFNYDDQADLYRSREGTFDEKSGIFTSPRGYYDWRTGRFNSQRGWHDYQTNLYRTPAGWYDPKSKLYHTKIPPPRQSPGANIPNHRRPRKRCCQKPFNRAAPPAVVIRAPSA